MNLIKTSVLGLQCSFIVFLFGNIDNNLKYLVSLIVIDFFTGLLSSFITKNNSIRPKVIINKVSYFAIISVTVILENMLKLENSIRTFVIYYFIYKEMKYILKNCKKLGETDVTSVLINILEMSKKTKD